MFAHTTSACASIESGTEPSGAIGTTPLVCSNRAGASTSTAWA